MNDTPETDLLLDNQHHDCVPYDDAAGQLADLACKLERERDNLKHAVKRLKSMSVCELGMINDSVRDYMEHWEGRAFTAERERDEALNVLREINDWINVAVMRPPTPNEAAHAINTWGDKIRPILEVTE